MHTLLVISSGFLLLAFCLLTALLKGGTGPGYAGALLAFLPLWFLASTLNFWFGVTKAGYTAREELPMFALVFGVPTLVAIVVLWRLRAGAAE